MAVLIKRSNKHSAIRNECGYGCCTDVYGKNTARIRRQIKAAEKAQVRRQIMDERE